MKSSNTLLFLLLLFAVVAGCQGREGRTPRGPACGGLLGIRCVADMYCQLNEGCGGIDQDGVCVPRPTECPREKSEVCACDGTTQTNSCYAAASALSVRHAGPCNQSPGVTPKPTMDPSVAPVEGTQ